MPERSSVEDALIALAREESGRVLALLARQFRDLDLADDSVQDALAEAPSTGRAQESRTTRPPGS